MLAIVTRHISYDIVFLCEVGVELTSSNYFSGTGELLTNTSGEMPKTCAREIIITYWCTSSTVLRWI